MRVEKSNVDQVKEYYQEYYMSLDGGFDSFYEEQLLQEETYLIKQKDVILGCCTIVKKNILCGVYIRKEFQHLYEDVFSYLIQTNNIKSIMGVTNDTLLLNQLLHNEYNIKFQAANYVYRVFPKTNFKLRVATLNDLELVEESFDDFLEDYKPGIEKQQLYLGYDNNELVSIGNVEYSMLLDNVVSIGMAVVEDKRNQGYGRKTIKALGQDYMQQGYTVQTGCWYYNHPSKRALKGALMSEANYIIIATL